MKRLGCVAIAVTLILMGPATSSLAAHNPGDNSGAIAFGDAGEIKVAAGGAVTNPIDNPANDSNPTWSPGGGRMAFVSDREGAAALYVQGPEGTQRIAEVENLEWRWSPDGRRVAWVSHSAFPDLWVIDLIGGGVTNLTNGTVEVGDFDWSPDGGRIGFEGDGDVFTIWSAGGSPQNLTGTPLQGEDHPRWSPDGTQIAFTSLAESRSSLEVMAANGSHRRVLATENEGGHLASPAWSPDGSLLAYAWHLLMGSPVLAGIEYYVVGVTGGLSQFLAAGSAYDGSGPHWSPSSKRLAMVFGGWGRKELTLVDADGGNRVSLNEQFTSTVCTADPSWAADGSQLAFHMSYGCTPMVEPGPTPAGEPPPGIFIVGAQGSSPGWLASGHSPDWKPPLHTVGLVDPLTGVWRLSGLAPFFYGNPGDTPFMGNWDNDGVDTPGLYRRSDGYVYLRNSNTQGVADIKFYFGNPGDIPLAGDFDGDGRDTVSIYRPSEQRFYIINELGSADGGLGAAEFSFLFGNPGDQPVVGDWDGDGVDEIGLYRTTSGSFYYRNTLDTGIADGDFYFGNPGDHFIAGDWGLADHRDTPAIFRPGNTTFYFRHSLTQGIADSHIQIGRSSWQPVAGVLGN